MIGIRIIWALFLAGMVAFAFHRAWKWEHGTPLPEYVLSFDEPATKETVVWVDAMFLPLLLFCMLIILIVKDGMGGMEKFLSLTLDVMLVISVHFLLLLFLLPVFRRYFSARACATMWLLPVFLFWQVHILLEGVFDPIIVIYIPTKIRDILFWTWVIGFVVIFAGKFVAHMIFRHRVLSVSYPVHDSEVLALFEDEWKALEYYRPIQLVISPAVTVPFSMGARKRNRVTVLPKREFTRQELQFIFRHEIHHLQRGDVGNKIFFAFCQALCWFNPLMWIATRKASDDLELSCDEIVLEGMDEGARRQYAELLLNTAGYAGGFTTCLSAAAETMRYRLKNVVTVRKRRTGTLLLFVTMFLCVMSYGTMAVSTDRRTVSELITEYDIAADITAAHYRAEDSEEFETVCDWDEEGLLSYLASLEVERINSINTHDDAGGRKLSLSVEDDSLWYVGIYDRMVEVYWRHDGVSVEYFYIRSDVDWARIERSLHL